MTDYYNELEVNRLSSNKEITNNFLRLSILWHPLNTNSKDKDITKKFETLCESYYVLINNKLKSIYNIHGYEKLKSGIYDKNFIKGFCFEENCINYFNKIFSENNIFTEPLKRENIDDKNFQLNDEYAPITNRKNIEIDFEVTLEHLYNGFYKRISYEKVIVNTDKRGYSKIIDYVNVKVDSENENNEKIIFEGKGNEYLNAKTSDLIVTIKFLKHEIYTLKKNNLYLNLEIDLFNALILKPIYIHTLDGRQIIYSLKEKLENNKLIKIENEGICKNNVRGDLFVNLNLIFPKNLDKNKINKIIEILNK